MFGIEIYYGTIAVPDPPEAGEDPRWQPGAVVQKAHVEAEALLLAMELALQGIAFKGLAPPNATIFERSSLDGSIDGVPGFAQHLQSLTIAVCVWMYVRQSQRER